MKKIIIVLLKYVNFIHLYNINIHLEDNYLSQLIN
jgi:hypothetical protein